MLRGWLLKMDLTTQLFNEKGSETDPAVPLYHGTREMLGLYDLVVSFKTKKCPHSCNFCALPQMSGEIDISREDLIKQIDWVVKEYSDELGKIEQITIRNEGSVLDSNRFYPEALDLLFEKIQNLPKLKRISLETRLEYLTEEKLKEIADKIGHEKELDLTVGFETQDEYILNKVLGKNINKKHFEEKVALLGKYNVNLTAYVMLKPDPNMTEEEGVQEALKSIDYLHELCERTNTNITIYINPTYAAKGSKLQSEMQKSGYKPPSKESLDLVMEKAREKGIKIYTD